jgi:hypothetical protein
MIYCFSEIYATTFIDIGNFKMSIAGHRQDCYIDFSKNVYHQNYTIQSSEHYSHIECDFQNELNPCYSL